MPIHVVSAAGQRTVRATGPVAEAHRRACTVAGAGPRRRPAGRGIRWLLAAILCAASLLGASAPVASAQETTTSSAATARMAVPFLSQFDGSTYQATNCGPTNLAMVLRYFGDARVTPDQLRRELIRLPGGGYAADTNSGTAIQDLAVLARARGVQVLMGPGPGSTGWTLARIAEQVRQGRPTMVLTRLNQLPGFANAPAGFEHWITITGVSGDNYTYQDSAMSAPAGANRSMTGGQLANAMRQSSVPGQGAAFSGRRAVGIPAPVISSFVEALPPPVRVAVALIRIGNGGLATSQTTRTEAGQPPVVTRVAIGDPPGATTLLAAALRATSPSPATSGSGSARFIAV